MADLVDALREKGLTTRRTPGRAERDVSYNSLLSMLRNPYYMGVVTYQGVTYQGQHPALVSPETWLRVQDILGAHAHAGEKDRVHQHYLRGTIFCGGCGRRLIFSRHVGRGGTYDYFLCPKRRTSTTRCPRRAIRSKQLRTASPRSTTMCSSARRRSSSYATACEPSSTAPPPRPTAKPSRPRGGWPRCTTNAPA